MPLKNRNITLLLCSLALIGASVWGYWKFVFQPLQNSISFEKRNVAELNSKLSLARARAGQLNKIQTEMQSLQVDVAELERQLPKSVELPSLIRVFTHRVESYGLTLASFAPQKSAPKGLYDEVPYQVSLSASFHTIGNFFTAMGKGERLFAARNLALQGTNSKTDASKTVTATFTLIAFKYHE
ncbi:MAG: type 4a pilus biogenesis protein PilO [Elusimicrobiota bacterium]|jgi:type IV pilus assembly protein PilO